MKKRYSVRLLQKDGKTTYVVKVWAHDAGEAQTAIACAVAREGEKVLEVWPDTGMTPRSY